MFTGSSSPWSRYDTRSCVFAAHAVPARSLLALTYVGAVLFSSDRACARVSRRALGSLDRAAFRVFRALSFC